MMKNKMKMVGLALLALLITPPLAEAQAAPNALAQAGGVHRNAGRDADAAEVLGTPARLVVQDVSIAVALDELQRTSGVAVAYSPTLLPPDVRVTCECAEATVEDALRTIIAGTSFEYAVMAGQLVIRPVVIPNVTPLRDIPPTSALARPQLGALNVARTRDAAPDARRVGVITGQVVVGGGAQTQAPLASAQVFIQSLDIGVLTQSNGRYVLLNVPAGTHTISAQRIGYRVATREVTVVDGETMTVDFALSEEALSLDEIVVTGTPGGTQRRALGNAVAAIDMGTEAQLSGAGSLEEILGNKLPGVQLTATSGAVGGGTKFRIRGSSSLALNGDPLIYIDGVRMDRPEAFAGRSSSVSTLQDINAADIERIEVIKGPAASTLYGTEAANGVIQIFTKRGVEGAPVFDASVELGTTFLQDPAGKLGPIYYADPQSGDIASINTYDIDANSSLLPYDPPANRPWFGKDPFRYGALQQYSLSVRGGTDLIRYFASANYVDEEGYTYLDSNERLSGRMSVTIVPDERLNISINGAQGTSRVEPGWFIQGYFYLFQPLQGRRPPMDAMINARDDFIEGTRSTWSATIEHTPFGPFRHRAVVGIDRNDFTDTSLIPRSTDPVYNAAYSDSRLGRKIIDGDIRETLTLDYAAIVNLTLTESISSTLSAGLQMYRLQEVQTRLDGREFATGALTTLDAAAQTSSRESFVENRTLGTYVQAETSWRDRIFLTGALRFDKNSAFGTNAKAATYPKVSASWVVSDEAFWQGSGVGSFLTQLRLRGAWGQSGQQPDVFAAQRLYQAVTGPGQSATLTPLAFGNPDLGPERGDEIELGFDTDMWDGRAQLEFTWYRRVTRDALVQRQVRPSIGFPGLRYENVGQISANGTEVTLNLGLIRQPNLEWSIASAFSTNSTNIDDMGGIGRIEVGRNQYHIEGFPVAGFYDLRVLSAEFDPGTTTVVNAMCDGGSGPSGLEMGGPPVPCDEADVVYYGQAEPAWTLALSSQLRYGDVTLRAVFDAKAGHLFNPDYLSGQNQWNSEQVVRQDDPIWMALRQYGARGAQVFADGDYLMLRELGLRYQIPQALMSSIGVDRASFSLTAHNVAVLWMKEGDTVDFGGTLWGPEIQSPANNYAGVNMGGQPPGSRVSARLDVSF